MSKHDNTECDGRHARSVSYLTGAKILVVILLPGIHGKREAVMVVQTFVHLAIHAIVLAAALMLALPFFLTLVMPFVGK